MASYYFEESAAADYGYRVEYTNADPIFTITGVYATGAGVTLPNGDTLNGIDKEVDIDNLIVDIFEANVATSDESGYIDIIAAKAATILT